MYRRVAFLLALMGLMGVGAFVTHGGQALAYGKADQPLAQLEFSGNCNNPDFWFCKDVVGTGGIWFWVEIDANGTGDVAGAGCGHTVGGAGGPGGASAGPIKGEVTWIQTSSPSGILLVTDPNGEYYEVTMPDGEVFDIPVTQGHYSWQPAPGVSVQIQVAP